MTRRVNRSPRLNELLKKHRYSYTDRVLPEELSGDDVIKELDSTSEPETVESPLRRYIDELEEDLQSEEHLRARMLGEMLLSGQIVLARRRGHWEPGVWYEKNDLVEISGSTTVYLAKQDHHSTGSNRPEENESMWEPVQKDSSDMRVPGS